MSGTFLLRATMSAVVEDRVCRDDVSVSMKLVRNMSCEKRNEYTHAGAASIVSGTMMSHSGIGTCDIGQLDNEVRLWESLSKSRPRSSHEQAIGYSGMPKEPQIQRVKTLPICMAHFGLDANRCVAKCRHVGPAWAKDPQAAFILQSTPVPLLAVLPRIEELSAVRPCPRTQDWSLQTRTRRLRQR